MRKFQTGSGSGSKFVQTIAARIADIESATEARLTTPKHLLMAERIVREIYGSSARTVMQQNRNRTLRSNLARIKPKCEWPILRRDESLDLRVGENSTEHLSGMMTNE
jgi:hypothetical protein